ncbi:hypothetical protein SAMN05421738_106192 [Algoriella xinjiangensis]|uniref:Lipoprotein n=1 Tax=Algoriella xinjiangensis TaxID=684065 RepID=A0A1I4W8R1_9FLAO|nr:hypothetical protein [Algoriella xinjiangensis]SFN09845.1 hypothetical protein SAMN05421738_106192 [Algoriella xinjiangensis]
MKKYSGKVMFLAVVIAFLTLNSCGTLYTTINDVKLKEVEKPQNSKERYGESKIISFDEDGNSKYSFEDDLIKIIWLYTSKSFNFKLENKSDSSIKILWDEASYIDENSSSNRIIHSGVKYIDASKPQPPTIIIKKANLEDIIIPAKNVYFSSSSWEVSNLFKKYLYNEEEKESFLKENIDDKTVKILLPLEVEGVLNEYIFSFNVKKSIEENQKK